MSTYDPEAPSAIRPTLAEPIGSILPRTLRTLQEIREARIAQAAKAFPRNPITKENAMTAIPIPPPRDEFLDQLVNDYLDAHADLEKVESRKAELAELIVKRLGVGGRHEVVPGVGVRVQAPASRFDGRKAMELLSDEQLRAISVSKPDSTMARKMLPGALVEQLTTTSGKPSVRAL